MFEKTILLSCRQTPHTSRFQKQSVNFRGFLCTLSQRILRTDQHIRKDGLNKI